jgi:double-strand break repair protein MRE11
MTDTIRILVATDNHVGAHERDPYRGDDSWKTFHEIMELGNEHEVDMVLLAGDLFHENKPSRKSMYNVMRSIRLNCLGPRPCELEILSDASQQFDATFDHVNYEDPDINVSIPVFSIHGNHDDPSGEGHFAALDILTMSGLVNYFGRTPEADDIQVKPVLLQKGTTKLALYGLSNVRDERLYQTFLKKKVKFFQAGTQQKDWFHLMCVHQNHYAHTETNYLPENFLPNFLDLVIWGHEHECLIDPVRNPEMGFQVMQPGSSVATSLMPGEAVEKQVTILSVTGREFKSEPIRLRSVRPFIFRDVILADDAQAVKIGKKSEHRTTLTAHLISIVEDMINEAKSNWEQSQEEAGVEYNSEDAPLPLIRLRVEYSFPDGTRKFQIENPQRFSNRFQGRVANTNDVVQFHIKKRTAAASAVAKAARDNAADEEIMKRIGNTDIQVSKLVKEFLDAQSLTILPTSTFGDAVTNFIEKDDKHAVEEFVTNSLATQLAELGRNRDEAESDEEDEGEQLMARIQHVREQLDAHFASAMAKKGNKKRFKAKPSGWNSEENGAWEDQPGALVRESRDRSADPSADSDEDGTPAPTTAGRGRGRGRGRAARGATGTRARAVTGRAAKAGGRGRKQVSESEDEDEDHMVLDDDEDDAVEPDSDSQAMFFAEAKGRGTQSSRATSSRVNGKAAATTASKAPTTRKTPARSTISRAAAGKKQGTINFSASQASVMGRGGNGANMDVEEIDDDSDAFEEASQQPVRRRR